MHYSYITSLGKAVSAFVIVIRNEEVCADNEVNTTVGAADGGDRWLVVLLGR